MEADNKIPKITEKSGEEMLAGLMVSCGRCNGETMIPLGQFCPECGTRPPGGSHYKAEYLWNREWFAMLLKRLGEKEALGLLQRNPAYCVEQAPPPCTRCNGTGKDKYSYEEMEHNDWGASRLRNTDCNVCRGTGRASK